MCTNGSRVARSTPANARRTGKPSPSRPEGAVVTESTGRSATVGSTAGTRGRTMVSALMAGMTAPRSGLAAHFGRVAHEPLEVALGEDRDDLGSKPAKTCRKSGHLARIVSQLSPDWNASRRMRSNGPARRGPACPLGVVVPQFQRVARRPRTARQPSLVLWHGSSITYLGYPLCCTSLKMWGLTLASCGRERGSG